MEDLHVQPDTLSSPSPGPRPKSPTAALRPLLQRGHGHNFTATATASDPASPLEYAFPEWKNAAACERQLRRLYFRNFHSHLPFSADKEEVGIYLPSQEDTEANHAHDLALAFIGFAVS